MAVYFYSPVIKSHAEGSAQYESFQVGVAINPYIGISVDKNLLELSAAPSAFVSGSVNVYVATNSYTGHTLTIEDVDSDTSMNPEISGITDKFESTFDGVKNSNTMPDETWGFSVDAADYYKIPPFGKSTLINKTNDSSPENPGYDTKTVNFGAKVGANTTSGAYSDVILFSAYANTTTGNPYAIINGEKTIVPVYKLGGTTENMQNFDCQLLEIGQTVNTTDLRDGNVYSVGRAADGVCWMRQNLRLTNYTLTPADSNVSSDFTVGSSDASSFGNMQNWLDDAVYYDNTNGAYYSFNTALAGSYDGPGIATSSVCPKEWRLPYEDELGTLTYAVTGSRYSSQGSYYNHMSYDYSPINLTLSGSFGSNGFDGVGELGTYWTSHAYIDRSTVISTINVSVEDGIEVEVDFPNGVTGMGRPVRCVTGQSIIQVPAEEYHGGGEM